MIFPGEVNLNSMSVDMNQLGFFLQVLRSELGQPHSQDTVFYTGAYLARSTSSGKMSDWWNCV